MNDPDSNPTITETTAAGPDSGPPASGSVLEALGRDVPRVQLRDPDSGATSPIVKPASAEMRGAAGGRLQLQGEIARGGMGAILKGRDTDLGRDIAVKVLLETHKGKTELKDNAERLALAQMCNPKKLYRAAARLYSEALAADPKLADDLRAGHRYDAACCAALAGCGKGQDAPQDQKDQVQLRQQALAWLQADLGAWRKRLDGGQPSERATVAGTLRHWQVDTDLAGVRDAAALKTLPAAEQSQWRKLWADVARTLKRAEMKQ